MPDSARPSPQLTDKGPPQWFGLTALVVANLLVALQAVLRGWGYYETLLVYWLEAVTIGAYNVLRLLVVGLFGQRPFGAWLSRRVGLSSGARLAFTLFGTAFFVIKFAGFALGVGVLVVGLPAFLSRGSGGGAAHVFAGLHAAGPAVGLAVGALVLSHGFSFMRNFLLGREYARLSVFGLIFWPYARLSLVVLVLGLGLVLARTQRTIADTTAFAVALVLVKLAADAATHVMEHRWLAYGASVGPGTAPE